MAKILTSGNYDEVIATTQPVIIDFWAEWCGPCRMVAPIVEELAKEYEGRAVICKCNVEEDSDDIVAKYMIRSIPTLIFLKNGEQVDKIVGATTEEEIVAKLEKLF
jgi:thioredoxin 1